MITIGFCTRINTQEHIDHLIKSCGLPKSKIEIIEIINNSDPDSTWYNGDISMGEAYNQIIDKAKFDIVVLCHDDIIMKTKNWGEKLVKQFKRNPEYGIIGVAGTTDLVSGTWWDLKKSMCGIVEHTSEGKNWTSKYSEDLGDKLKEVVLVDGLFIAFDKNKIKKNFNVDFKGFHFYDVVFCVDNYLAGVKIAVTNKLKILHKSVGATNEQWEENKVQFEKTYTDKLPIKLTSNRTVDERLIFNPNSIGVGMVTYNAEDRIKLSSMTIPNWVKHFVIVNDGTPYDISSYPEHAHIIQHETNKCVGAAKNTAIEYLLKQDCEHIFLIEDDMIIKDENVFEEYVKHSIVSGIKHLNFGLHGPANKKDSTGFTNLVDRKDNDNEPNPRKIIKYEDGVEMAFYPNCVGSFSYYNREVLEKIGGFDKAYVNAWEHVEHTFKTINAHYHPSFWYFADINKSWEYLTDIPNSIENSTIARSDSWKQNNINGLKWFAKNYGGTPMEIPLATNEFVDKQLSFLYLNR